MEILYIELIDKEYKVDYFDIATKNAHVLLSTTIDEFDISNKEVIIDGNKSSYDLVVSTISPDILYNYKYFHILYMYIYNYKHFYVLYIYTM